MECTFEEYSLHSFYTVGDAPIIYRKMSDTYAWIFRGYYCNQVVYEPAIGTPKDVPMSPDCIVQPCEVPTKRYYAPTKRAV